MLVKLRRAHRRVEDGLDASDIFKGEDEECWMLELLELLQMQAESEALEADEELLNAIGIGEGGEADDERVFGAEGLEVDGTVIAH